MPLDQFATYVAWPGDRYYYSWGADPTNEAGPSTTGVDDEFNTKLDDF